MADCYQCAIEIESPTSFILGEPWCDDCLDDGDLYALFEKDGREAILSITNGAVFGLGSDYVHMRLGYLRERTIDQGSTFKVLGNLEWLIEEFVKPTASKPKDT